MEQEAQRGVQVCRILRLRSNKENFSKEGSNFTGTILNKRKRVTFAFFSIYPALSPTLYLLPA